MKIILYVFVIIKEKGLFVLSRWVIVYIIVISGLGSVLVFVMDE